MKINRLLPLALALLLGSVASAQPASPKLSAHLNRMAARHATKASSTPAGVDALATLAVPCNAQAFFARHGCRLIDSVGRIYIIHLPLGTVATLAANDTVERLEAERMPQPAMDVTPGQVNATGIYSGQGLPQAYDGTGVVAGVFDSYFDFTHPAFQTADGEPRIQYYYDFHWPNADSTMGHAIVDPDTILAQQHSLYTNNQPHGTHVTGIMAGSAVNGQLQGMAPGSDIYLADFNSDRAQFENPDAHTSATAVLGFKYIFDRATAEGKPCVINFSSCESITLLRQRTLEAEALQALVGPGRIIVAGAGNDGTRACYLEKPDTVLQAGAAITNGLYGGGSIDIDLVTNGDQLVRFDFFGMGLTGGGIEGTISFHTDSIDTVNGSHFTTTVSMGDVAMDVTVSPQTDPRGTVYHIDASLPNGAYLFLCGATVLLTGNNPAWMYSDISFSPLYNVDGMPQYSYVLPGRSVSWPACLPRIVAVGATGYKSSFTDIDGNVNYDVVQFEPDSTGHIAKFSSCGPTFDGRVKPDVVAPGMSIIAAYNSFNPNFADMRKNLTHHITHNGSDYYYLAESGTSMSSPVVAGAVALWLQAKPDLTPEQVLDVISRTSTHPDASMQYPNNTYGHGQIDAYNGLLQVLNLPVLIPDLSDHQPQRVTFRLAHGYLQADFGQLVPNRMTYKVYSIDGRLLLTQSGRPSLDLRHFSGQVLAVQLITDSPLTTGSTLIRVP